MFMIYVIYVEIIIMFLPAKVDVSENKVPPPIQSDEDEDEDDDDDDVFFLFKWREMDISPVCPLFTQTQTSYVTIFISAAADAADRSIRFIRTRHGSLVPSRSKYDTPKSTRSLERSVRRHMMGTFV